MSKHHHISKTPLLFAVLLMATLVIQVILPKQSFAAQITARSLTLEKSSSDLTKYGGSRASGMVGGGGTVDHFFQFTLPGGNSVGSIKFQYCTTAATTTLLDCTVPAGLNTTSITVTTETGWSGVAVNNTTNGVPYIYKAGGATAVGANQAVTYRLHNVVNPSANNTSFYVRITTYNSTDTTGAELDRGVVTASTAEAIVLDGTMPESLVFCTGETIATTAGVPDCASPLNTDGIISFDRLFSPADTAIATSQMAASTNAGGGYAITVNGTTLMSGTNFIDAIDGADPNDSRLGISQFGLNLVLNGADSADLTDPDVGANVAPAYDGANYRGAPVAASGYDVKDQYRYVSSEVVANSSSAGAGQGATNAQIYTVSYIANVPGNQPAGNYTTTLTYICTPTF